MTMTTTTTTKKKKQTARLRLSHVLLLALAPFAVLAIGARVLVARGGVAIARRIAAVASWASIDARFAENARPLGADPVANSPPPLPLARAPASAARRAPPERGERTPARAVQRGPVTIFISEDRLLHLASTQLRGVGGTTVVDGHGHPAGVRLSGVGALGVGLSDGDVVTRIGGRPTPTADDATAAGIAAWSAGLHTVQAAIVRGGETIAVTVEIPSIDAHDAGIRGVSGSTNPGSGRM